MFKLIVRDLHGTQRVTCHPKKLLTGVTPRHCRYLSIWPPAYETLSVLVLNLFNLPSCDFGVAPIDGGLRGLVAYVASR